MQKKLIAVFACLVLATMACGLPSVGGSTQPTSAGGTQPTAAQASNILFKDDFSDSGSGWSVEQTDNGTTSYENGGYRIHVITPNYDKWGNPEKSFQSDVRIEVDATETAGPNDIDMGILCRYQDTDNFYQLIITVDGYAGIIKNVGGNTSIISSADGKLQPVKGINSGSSSNHIRADCIGDTLTLYANGDQVATATDSSLTGGDVGLIAGNYDTGGADVLFNNFFVYKP